MRQVLIMSEQDRVTWVKVHADQVRPPKKDITLKDALHALQARGYQVLQVMTAMPGVKLAQLQKPA